MKSVRIRRDSLPDHPWVYRKQVASPEPGTRNGDPVRILGSDGRPLGAGLFNGKSQLAIRVLTMDPAVEIDRAFLAGRLDRAVRLRRETLRLEERTDAFRVVNSEGDGLSGLIVDRYGDLLVAQIRCLGFFRLAPEVREILRGHFPGARMLFRRDREAEKIEGFRVPDPEEGPPTEIRCDGLRFGVDPAAGHKTGLFLDQRDNRRLAATAARGRDVLDLFCYEGAFALACAKAGAKSVRGADLDEAAIARARENARRNRLDVEFTHADAFEILRGRPRTDFLLLDPPRWISSPEDDAEGRRRYMDLNRLAMEALPEGALLMTSSCSGRLSRETLLGILREAAARAGKHLRFLSIHGPAPDHPVPANFPEGHYLTAVFAVVG
jgi:23S rRNA (cytosine1962-C5)-methyltransferase